MTTNGWLHGGKSQLYEGGIRVPLIVRAPKLQSPGRTCDVPVSSIDFYPTLLDAAIVHAPRNHRIDGVSFVHAVMQERAKAPTRPLFWYYPLAKPHFLGGRSAAAIRKGDFKLIHFLDDDTAELYNLKDDEAEMRDLSKQMPQKAAELRRGTGTVARTNGEAGTASRCVKSGGKPNGAFNSWHSKCSESCKETTPWRPISLYSRFFLIGLLWRRH